MKQDSFLFLITEVLQSCKRSSLAETNKNRSGVVAKAPAPWRAQVERGDQSPGQRQQHSTAPPNFLQSGIFPTPATLIKAMEPEPSIWGEPVVDSLLGGLILLCPVFSNCLRSLCH